MKYYTLKVLEIRTETNDTVTVVFKQPALKKVKYSAGQYLTLIFRINGRRYIRPYSFSSAPTVDESLEITVKRVPGGIVSNHIIDKLKAEDAVEVMEPLGNFTINDNVSADAHVVLWGAGSGITPLMSIAKYSLAQKTFEHVTLVYGNRNEDSIIFSSKIQQLTKHYENFTVWHFHTRLKIASGNPYLIEGRIDATKIISVLKTEKDIKNTYHYICGPTGLKESVKKELLSTGVPNEHIYAEDFEVVRNPADFEEIITRQVTIDNGDSKLNIEVTKGKSILEAGLDAMLDLSYSCQTGDCLVCKATLVRGEVKTIGVEKLPEGLLQDECLLCSSFPLTDDIIIKVN